MEINIQEILQIIKK